MEATPPLSPAESYNDTQVNNDFSPPTPSVHQVDTHPPFSGNSSPDLTESAGSDLATLQTQYREKQQEMYEACDRLLIGDESEPLTEKQRQYLDKLLDDASERGVIFSPTEFYRDISPENTMSESHDFKILFERYRKEGMDDADMDKIFMQSAFEGATIHLREAITELNDRRNPEWRILDQERKSWHRFLNSCYLFFNAPSNAPVLNYIPYGCESILDVMKDSSKPFSKELAPQALVASSVGLPKIAVEAKLKEHLDRLRYECAKESFKLKASNEKFTKKMQELTETKLKLEATTANYRLCRLIIAVIVGLTLSYWLNKITFWWYKQS